ncbi:MAG: hypothetical protein A2887_03370 [Alphaproteobacteria bacterium RIFCSPLOWO2_01_FULL_40_26]|nr:MAG: hypothetical protein A3D15_03775 [Alphaproteobacteria bacterium RIFCSPHIGHO2_02_FULL_40_34]OFW94479.1 MAG: hypothetical protein A2887_03370 [Alphaproteobacteria bacterium RIFCSPLOWO2_01_FULL_40_26]OFX10190.1 MAG: hypothetical protein A3H30_01545 [Alphaproteobacteria bacterium RIFCSPLOWO2_02_FULL_40_19]
MHPLIRLTIRLAIISFIIVAAIQPFNWFCQLTQKCQPFYFSYYIPKHQGWTPIDIVIETTNYYENIEFSAQEPAITTFPNKKTAILYNIKNLGKTPVRIRPKLIVEPQYAEKYLTKYECLCMREIRLKAKEEKELKMEFEINREIEHDAEFEKNPDKVIKIRYKI